MSPSHYSLKALIDPYQAQRPVDWDKEFGLSRILEVEIGCGLGEYLIRQAQEHPEHSFVGIEQEWKRTRKILPKIEAAALPNVRIFPFDARIALERYFSPFTIDRIHCLFPCPWPKKRHTKHRLFSHRFLELLNSRLKSRGVVHIVTDYHPFLGWMIEEVQETGFQVTTQTVPAQYDTKYERKWFQAGQKNFFELRLLKERHIDIPIKRDVGLKIFSLKHFNPDRFFMIDESTSPVIIFKDFLFDGKQEKGMTHLIVAEEDMTQHLWVSIARMPHEAGWRIAPAEGCRFIPTAGIQKAIEAVYRASLRSQAPE